MFSLGLFDRGGTITPALGDLKVRQAINYAINRTAITRALFPGAGVATDQTTIPGNDSYSKAFNSAYPYNVAKAKQLMTQAGFPNGFTMNVVTTPGIGLQTFEEALAGQLSRIGITLQPVVETTENGYTNALTHAQYPAGTIDFPGLATSLMYSFMWGTTSPMYNPFNTASSTLAALEKQYLSAGPSWAPAIAQKMSKYIVDQAWFAPVVETPLTAFATKGITGVQASSKRAQWYLPEVKPA